MNSYELSRRWFDYCFENPEKIRPIHSAVYFFAIEHCNRLGWKEKFGFPSQMVMEAIGVKNWRTYTKALNELVEMGFIELIQKSKNQWSSCIIAIVKSTQANNEDASVKNTKALDKALSKHGQKHCPGTVSIDKPNNKELCVSFRTREEFEEAVKPLFAKLDAMKHYALFCEYWCAVSDLDDRMRWENDEYFKSQLTLKIHSWIDKNTTEEDKKKKKRSIKYGDQNMDEQIEKFKQERGLY